MQWLRDAVRKALGWESPSEQMLRFGEELGARMRDGIGKEDVELRELEAELGRPLTHEERVERFLEAGERLRAMGLRSPFPYDCEDQDDEDEERDR